MTTVMHSSRVALALLLGFSTGCGGVKGIVGSYDDNTADAATSMVATGGNIAGSVSTGGNKDSEVPIKVQVTDSEPPDGSMSDDSAVDVMKKIDDNDGGVDDVDVCDASVCTD